MISKLIFRKPMALSILLCIGLAIVLLLGCLDKESPDNGRDQLVEPQLDRDSLLRDSILRDISQKELVRVLYSREEPNERYFSCYVYRRHPQGDNADIDVRINGNELRVKRFLERKDFISSQNGDYIVYGPMKLFTYFPEQDSVQVDIRLNGADSTFVFYPNKYDILSFSNFSGSLYVCTYLRCLK